MWSDPRSQSDCQVLHAKGEGTLIRQDGSIGGVDAVCKAMPHLGGYVQSWIQGKMEKRLGA